MSSHPAIYRQISKIARRNVLRNWRHSMATILAITAGVAAISLFDGFISSIRHQTDEGMMQRAMLGDLIIQQKGTQLSGYQDIWKSSLDPKEQAFINGYLAQDKNVVHYVHFLSLIGVAEAGGRNSLVTGYGYDIKEGAAMRERFRWTAAAGVPLEEAKVPSIQLAIGLGRTLGCVSTYSGPEIVQLDGTITAEERPFQCESRNVVLNSSTESGQANSITLPVAGLFDVAIRELDRRSVNIDIASAKSLMDTERISNLTVTLVRPDLVADFIQRFQAAAKAQGFDFEVIPWTEHLLVAPVVQLTKIVKVFHMMFMIIVVLIGVMSIANTMMKSVNERIREIGTLRSLGFLRHHLILMFSLEGMYLSLMASTMGVIIAGIGSQFVGKLGYKISGGILSSPITVQVRAEPMAWLSISLLLIALATTTAFLASRRAAGMVIADAMRHV